ncbi:hypothetical protein [Streptomyces sp. IBSBF 3136]|uniref:hypothetical protein n=1 Tax=Streptomyces sp. IBSBF 3136 TaxID=2903524 RepID=UPI002FDC4D8D
MVRESLVRRLACVVSIAALMTLGLVGTAEANGTGTAQPAATHWYTTPNPGNDCGLNLRSSASTSGTIVGHLSSCSQGAWCWYQTGGCGSTVTGGSYTCNYADGSSGLHDNKWARVADKNGKLAYVAKSCGFAQQL